MFPTQITIHNVSDLQKVMSVLYPTTAVVEVTDKSRDLAHTATEVQTLVNKAEAKVAAGKSNTSAATQAEAAPTQPTAEAVVDAAPEKTAGDSAPSAADAASAAQASTAATDAPALKYDDIKAGVVAAIKAGHRQKVMDLLAKLGVDHAEKLKPEQWPEAHAALKGMVA